VRLTQRSILLFWAPLAATWLMMALEGPFLAAVIARLADAKFNLAAHGVAFAFAILVEAPVIMLMSAATALVQDSESFRKMRNFSRALGVGSTLLLLIVLIPPFYEWLMLTVIGLPREVSDLTYGALWLYLPWPAAIGYRRFYQGVLIRSGKTRLVAYGTVIRLAAMGGAALFAFFNLDIPGASIGALALSAGVVVEAAAARWMVAASVRELYAAGPAAPGSDLSYREIASFYYPLALTSLIGLTVHPMLTFFMGRAPNPVDSLAVFPVVNALSFLFRAVGLSFQDATIALMGERHKHLPELSRFTVVMGLSASLVLAAVAFTPLADIWFQSISGLTPELAAFAYLPAQIIVPLPALTVLLGLQRGMFVNVRRTRSITLATAIEVTFIAVTFVTLGWGLGVIGATAAFVAFVVGRLAANTFLGVRGARIVRDTAEQQAG
jgi:Na+-driven multidrug efflux pump